MTPRTKSPLVITLTLYLLALMTMATIGVLVPFIRPIAAALHASGSAIGFGIALFSLPPALFATVGGSLMDRLGVRRALIAAGLVTIVGDLLIRSAGSVWMLDAGLLFDGVGMALIAIGNPALLMASLRDTTRTRAMAFLSTYAPTGFALGLLMAIPFTTTASWRSAVLAHALLALLATLLAMSLLPAASHVPAGLTAVPRALAGQRGAPFLGYRRAVRLGLAIALPNGIAYGTSLVAPSYLAHAEHISLAASAGAVASAKIVALILGGLVTGQVLASRNHPWLVFVAMAATGLAAQILFFVPFGSLALAICALVLWLFAFGGMSAVAMSLLPQVVPEPGRKAATTGLVNQLISIVSFGAPSTYFSIPFWGGFIAIALVGLATSVSVLPMLRIEQDPEPFGVVAPAIAC